MIYLIRHCSTAGQEPEAVLTKEGEYQADKLALFLEHFGIQRIVSSPYRRAVQSIEVFAKQSGIPIEIDARLRERTLSGAPINNWQTFLARTFDEPDFSLPGGETSREAWVRAAESFHDALESGKTTALISHGNLSALLLRYLGLPFGMEESMGLTNPDVYRIEVIYEECKITHIWNESH
jgi:2,3-bisphosphoglycerate-dependent phosphoglycerate mutase